MAKVYYGLKDQNGRLVQKGWTSLPEFDLYFISHYSNFQHGHLYVYVDTVNDLRYSSSFYQGAPYHYSTIQKETGSKKVYNDYEGDGGIISQGIRNAYRVTSRTTTQGYDIGYELKQTARIGDTVYSREGTQKYTIVQYYVTRITAITYSVNNVQVGNIAICDTSGNVLAGSVSTTEASGTTSYTYNLASESTEPQVRIVASAIIGNQLQEVIWNRRYFYNGIYKDNVLIPDNSTTFSHAQASVTVTLSKDTRFECKYDTMHILKASTAAGVNLAVLQFTPTHNTGTYYFSTRPTESSVQGNYYGELLVEHGATVNVSASSQSGYMFGTGNGFISQTDGVNSIYGTNGTYVEGRFTLTKETAFNVTVSTCTISISIADHPEWGSVYINNPGTTSTALVQGETYRFYFASSRGNYEAPAVATWYVNGTAISGNTYTANTISGGIAVTCTLRQNAWPVYVSAGANGSASISGRYNKQTGAQLANTGYLRADGSEYIKVAVAPTAHYDVSSVAKPGNIVDYTQGGPYAYSMTSGASATIYFSFALAECVIKTLTNNPELCETRPPSTTLRFDAQTAVNVYCQIKNAYIEQYRVDYFEAGGVQYPAETGGAGQYYYAVYASILGGRSEVTFIPHLVSTSNALTVTKSGTPSLATVYIQVDGGSEETISGSSWSGQVRENRPVIIRAVAAFGGQLSAITSSGITDPSITESQISFSMPANEARVDFAISEKDKVTLALCVSNVTDPEVAVGKVILTCPASASIHEEVATLAAQTFEIYKATTYTLTADDSDDTYTFSGWYLDDSMFISSDLSLSINHSNNLSTKYTARYVMRTSGTIAVSYGIKSGDDVIATELPAGALAFGLAIDTKPDQTNPDKWVIGNNRYIDFHVLDDGTSVEEGITYIWTPVRVDARGSSGSENWNTIWTYDAKTPESRSGRFVMRDDMLVRLVFTKVQAEGYARVQALFVDGNTNAMGELSIFATGMLSYNSTGGVAEAACYVGRKAVLAAAPKPGYAFGGWFKKAGDGKFVSVKSNGAVLTVDTVTSAGAEYYADFTRSESAIRAWNDGAEAKTFEWRSKVFVGAQFLVLRNVRVYSDKYPVTLTLMTATSPNGCFEDGAHALALVITSQSPRQIPAMRLEKYFAFKIQGSARINHVAVASSMEGLK